MNNNLSIETFRSYLPFGFMVDKKRTSPLYIGTIKYDDKGKVKISEYRRSLKGLGTVCLKGRNPNRKQFMKVNKERLGKNYNLQFTSDENSKVNLQQSIPLSYSTSVDIYLRNPSR